MIRILNIEPLDYSQRARGILESFAQVTEREVDRQTLLELIPEYQVLIVRLRHQIDADVLTKGKALKCIVSATTGLDHIDLEFARTSGVAVLSLEGETDFLESIWASAEHTWALLLSLIRRVPSAQRSVFSGRWDRDDFKGRELSRRRLGIVGLGRIGRKVARYGAAFNMSVAAYSPFSTAWPSGVTRADTLSELLRDSDVVSIHVSYNSHTRLLFGETELAMMPRGSVLVNTSRGGVVDENALYASLSAGHLGGAAVDVMDNERDLNALFASPLLTYAKNNDNLIITPHIAGATVDSMEMTEVFMARKLERFFVGTLPSTESALLSEIV